MSDINEETVRTLCRLCRIELKDDEIGSFMTSLKRVVDYFDQLQEVDCDHLSPYIHIEPQGVHALREDVEGTLLPRETFLANAPDHIGGMIRTPPVIKST